MRAKVLQGAHNKVYAGDLETYGWGDLNFDGRVDMRDATAMNAALAGSGGLDFGRLIGASVTVPEPATVGGLALSILALITYRRFQP